MPCFSGLVVPRAAIRHARCRRGKRAQRRGAQGAAQRIARHDATVAAQVAGPQAAAQGPASMGRGETPNTVSVSVFGAVGHIYTLTRVKLPPVCLVGPWS